uniref:DUF4789 domain-containing protein n=1 Tax=Glossina brevipalpis TaxID=37001 RepID=A0A1A9VZA9_9MUSC
MKLVIKQLFVCLVMTMQMVSSQLAYPEVIDISKDKANLQGRLPLFSPARCKDYELLYPGDQKNDWICDCAPGAVYYPDADACYPAFRRGPCEAEEILVLPNAKIIPTCVSNECKLDGKVKIQNNCYDLGRTGPCQNTPVDNYIVGVDPKTLQVDCILLSLEKRFGLESLEDVCANRGSKKYIKGDCTGTK